MPKVSVIIPVYNTASYLKSAVGSILNQTLRDIEVLIVNDGSTDSSLEIIKEIQAGDSRVQLFSQSNSGQSAARNLALEYASGEFVYFMDSDDILNIEALDSCYNLAKQKKLDLVFFDATVIKTSESLSFSGFNYDRSTIADSDKIYSGLEIIDILLTNNLFRAAPWLHFISKALIDKLSLRFYPGIIHEDELFTPQLYLSAQRVGYIPEMFFSRRVRENSTMSNSFSDRNIRGYFTVIEQLRNISDVQRPNFKKTINRLISKITESVTYQSGQLPFKKRAEVLLSLLNNGCFRYTKPKNLTILIFPFVIKLKSLLVNKKS